MKRAINANGNREERRRFSRNPRIIRNVSTDERCHLLRYSASTQQLKSNLQRQVSDVNVQEAVALRQGRKCTLPALYGKFFFSHWDSGIIT